MPNADLITPGLTQCDRCKRGDAVAILTEPGRERYPEALCFDCIELDLERERAAAVSRAGADIIAVAGDEVELALVDQNSRDLLEKLSTSAKAQAAARCWAILPSEERCKRKATAARYGRPFLCDTHRHGARVPGLGWSQDGKPVGRILEARA